MFLAGKLVFDIEKPFHAISFALIFKVI